MNEVLERNFPIIINIVKFFENTFEGQSIVSAATGCQIKVPLTPRQR